MVKNKISDTKLAIQLIPIILSENKNKHFSFEEIFNILVEKKPTIFLDDIGDKRYGILRGIVSRYQSGNLFLKNVIIYKNELGILQFKYSYNDLLKNKTTYKLYINTISYHHVIKDNQITFDDFIELSIENQEFIKSITQFNKSIESFLSSYNLKEE